MHPVRALAAAALLTVGLALPAATPATAQALAATTTTLTAPIVHTYDTAVPLEGRVTDSSGAVAGRPVRLYTRPAGRDVGWSLLGTTTTDAAGRFGGRHRTRVHSEYLALFPRTEAHETSRSSVRRVDLRRAVTLTVTRDARGTLHFAGKVTPPAPGARLSVHEYAYGWWSARFPTHPQSSTGHYTIALSPKDGSSRTFRTVMPTGDGWATGYSPTVTVPAA